MSTHEASSQHKLKTPALTSRAKELRHSGTLAEKLARAFSAIASCFVPLGAIIVDFCFLSLRLVVELEGAGHAFDAQATKDRERDQLVVGRGYRVLQFPNGTVLKAPMEFVKKVGECITELEQARLKGFRS